MSEIPEAPLPPIPPSVRPRLTTSRLLILMIPLAAYFAVFGQILRMDVDIYLEIVPGPVAVELALLAASGFAVAHYRRATFVGAAVQMTTTPVLLQALLLAMQSYHAVHVLPPIVLLFVGWAPYWLGISKSRERPGRSRTARAEIAESIAAGAANLALIVAMVTVTDVLFGGLTNRRIR